MIAVSATDQNDAGQLVQLRQFRLAGRARRRHLDHQSRGGSYDNWNGTSFASPLAAGVAALMMAAAPSLDGARSSS
jgi:thermitase